MSYTILVFYLSLVFDYLLDSVMPQHLFHVPYSITNNLHHSVFLSSILHPLFIFCHSSFPSSISHLSHHLFYLPSSGSLFFCSILSLSSQHPFITPCLPIPTLTTYHSPFLHVVLLFLAMTHSAAVMTLSVLTHSIYDSVCSTMTHRHTVAQKTAPMFAHFSMIALVQHADIIQGFETFVHKTTSS